MRQLKLTEFFNLYLNIKLQTLKIYISLYIFVTSDVFIFFTSTICQLIVTGFRIYSRVNVNLPYVHGTNITSGIL